MLLNPNTKLGQQFTQRPTFYGKFNTDITMQH